MSERIAIVRVPRVWSDRPRSYAGGGEGGETRFMLTSALQEGKSYSINTINQ